jgi:hypothetical protein
VERQKRDLVIASVDFGKYLETEKKTLKCSNFILLPQCSSSSKFIDTNSTKTKRPKIDGKRRRIISSSGIIISE